jgi:uncharacterized protein (TIGR02391 family)
MPEPSEISATSLAILPVDELAIWMLRRIVARERPTHQRLHLLEGLLKELGERTPTDAAYTAAIEDPEVAHLAQALAEAWNWLASNGLIAEAITGMLGGRLPLEHLWFVTRLGHRVADHPRPVQWVVAERRLGVSMHPRLEERARRQFVLGEFAAAALVAMREVEIAVRERGGFGDTVVGADLMNKAFGTDGPLADLSAPKAERDGMRALFQGAISVFKNPASHRQVQYEDPVQAAEIVLLADLLLRMLDAAEVERPGPIPGPN